MPFTSVDTTTVAPTRLILAPWGQAKEGKSTLALSFPEPVYLFNMDHSYKELLGNFPGKEIYVADYQLTEDYDTNLKSVEQFRADWIEAVNQAQARGGTVIQDKSSQFWALVGPTLKDKAHRKRMERNSNAREMQTDYALPNSFMDQVLKRPYHFERVNAVYIMGAKERYSENGQALGTYLPHGWGDTESVVQVVLGMSTIKGQVMGTINRCRFGKAFEGMQIADPTYDTLMAVLS